MKVAAVLLWLGFLVVAVVVKTAWLVPVDTHLILAFRAHAPGLETVMRGTSWTAGNGAAFFAVAIALIVGVRGGARSGWMYAFACLGGWVANLILKESLRNVRPNGISPKLTDAGWYSFPSGHAMMALLIFGFGAVLVAGTMPARGARVAIIAFGSLVTLAVGLSRIYLGAHWPSDVMGAYLAGAGWAVVCLLLRERADARAAGTVMEETAAT